jgi:hypothetical protein
MENLLVRASGQIPMLGNKKKRLTHKDGETNSTVWALLSFQQIDLTFTDT